MSGMTSGQHDGSRMPQCGGANTLCKIRENEFCVATPSTTSSTTTTPGDARPPLCLVITTEVALGAQRSAEST